MGVFVCLALFRGTSLSAPKVHLVAFGKWSSIRVTEGEEPKTIDLKVRALLVDGRMKEFTAGVPHDVTDRTFTVQRVYRLNDSLPQDSGAVHWLWQRGGWLLVDRVTGKVQPIVLPEYDPNISTVNWFRDYAAYCGTSDDGQKNFAVVAQLGRRKPLLKKALADTNDGEDLNCSTPVWQRGPIRVIFEHKTEAKFTYTVRSRTVDFLSNDAEDGGQ
jgi:hypothetical protein